MLQRPGFNVATVGSVVLVVIHLIIFSTGGIYSNESEGGLRDVIVLGGLSWDGVASGQVWQIFTYLWLHGGWGHLIVNVVLFYYGCARLSHVLSEPRILALFLATGIGSGLIHIFAQAVFPGLSRDPLVGASGGVMGLILAYFALSPGSRMLLIPVSASNLAKGVLIASSLLFMLTPSLGVPLFRDLGQGLVDLFGEGVFRIAHLLHFSGGLIGWIAIPGFFPKLMTLEDLVRMRKKSELAGS